MTARTALRLNEATVQDGILGLARPLGIRVVHFRPALTKDGRWRTPVEGDAEGWPDLTLIGTRLIVREVKGDGGRLDPDQAQWLDDLTAAGVDAAVWTADMWRSGAIQAEMRAIARRGVRR
jgi:VRR-NUC domain